MAKQYFVMRQTRSVPDLGTYLIGQRYYYLDEPTRTVDVRMAEQAKQWLAQSVAKLPEPNEPGPRARTTGQGFKTPK